jgi:hypothetical protein
MGKQFSQIRRIEAAKAVFDIDICWSSLFPEGDLKDLCYCDLFTQLWLDQTTPRAKTDLYKLMPNISPRTAVKYVQLAIELGMLNENISDVDHRVRLITMSEICKKRVESFLDFTCERFSYE